jgi:PAS domain S-box-containing protein
MTSLIKPLKPDEKLQYAVDVTLFATLIINAQGIIQYLNDNLCKLLGYHRAELLGQPIECLIPQAV